MNPAPTAQRLGLAWSPTGQPLTAEQAALWLYAEADCLDNQRWDDWLGLYAPDACLWMPAWVDEHQLATSPDAELSMIYISARAGLEDRVWRVRSGLSVASETLPRTCHAISNVIRLPGASAEAVELRSNWRCDVYDIKRDATHMFFGRYEHRLQCSAQGWSITAKKIVLLNERIPAMLDFYCV